MLISNFYIYHNQSLISHFSLVKTMGGAVSASSSNAEMINKLIEAGYIDQELVEHVLKVVDRAHYYIPEERRIAYHDSAWRNGNLHLSAPCIYAQVSQYCFYNENRISNPNFSINFYNGYILFSNVILYFR